MKRKKNIPSKPLTHYAPGAKEEVYEKIVEQRQKPFLQKLTADGKLLAVLSLLTFIVAIFAIPGVMERFSKNRESKPGSARPHLQPPATVQPAKPQYLPLPNTPMSFEKFNNLYSQSYPTFKDIKIPKLDLHYSVVVPTATAQQHLISTGDLYASLPQESIESSGVPVSVWLSIDLQGKVTDVTPVDKATTLSPQVISAVKQWQYRPFVYHGITAFARTMVTLKLNHLEPPIQP